MKRNLLLLIVLCCTMTMLAQNGKISYQAVVRDSENHLVYDTPLQVTVSLANSETGTAVYSEQHAVTSNANGLISLLIGDGENKQGHWEDVQWNTAWVTATIRKASDQTFLAEHHLPLSAVPYALYADFADSVNLAVLQDYLDEHHYVTEDELPAVQANADWTETNPDTASYIKNKPDLNDYEKKSELCGDVKECIKDTLGKYTTTNQIDTLLGAYYDTTHTKSVISDTATALRAMMGDAAYNSKITLKKNNVELDSFRLNQQNDKAINIPIPTTVAELSDAGNYVTKTKLNDTLGAYYDTANVKQMLKPYLKANELCDSIVKCDVIKNMRDSLANAFDTLKYYTTSDQIDTLLDAYATTEELALYELQENLCKDVKTCIKDTLGKYTTSNEIDTLLGAYYDSSQVKSVISDTATALRAMMGDAAYNAKITLKKNNVELDSFRLNQQTDKAINIPVPTTVAELSDAGNYVTKTKLNDTLGAYYDTANVKQMLKPYLKANELCDSIVKCDVIKDMRDSLGNAFDTLSYYYTSKKINDTLKAYFDSSQVKSVISDTANAIRAAIPASQVQSDWTETDNTKASFIQNKPQIPAKISDLVNDSRFADTTADNHFTGTNTVPSGYHLSGANATNNTNCGNVVVNACDLWAVFDSLMNRIDSVSQALTETQNDLEELKNSTPPVFGHLELTDITATAITATASFSSIGAPITSYDFCIKRSDVLNAPEQCFTSTSNVFTFNNLDSYTPYSVTVSATNMAGTSSSNAANARTLAKRPNGELTAETSYPNGIHVTVEHLDFGGAPSGEVKVYYKKQGSAVCGNNVTEYTDSLTSSVNLTPGIDNVFEQTIENLESSVAYCVMVKLSNADSSRLCGPQLVESGSALSLTLTSNTNEGTLDVCENDSVAVLYEATPSIGTPNEYSYKWSVVGTSKSQNTENNNTVEFFHTVGHYTISCTATSNTNPGVKVSNTYSVTVTNSGHVPTFSICSDSLRVNLSNILYADTVTWGDNTKDNITSNSAEHDYATSNVYTIAVKNSHGCVATKVLPIGLSTLHPCEVSSKNTNEDGTGNTINSLQDIDGNWYAVAQIGNQCWMKSNLRTTRYSDGTAIANGTGTNTDNTLSHTTAYYYKPNPSSHADGSYDLSKYNFNTYGLYYNWKATMRGAESSDQMPSGVQGVCPDGWHVPSLKEWDSLIARVQLLPNATYYDHHSIGYMHVLAGGCEWDAASDGRPGHYKSPARNSSEFSAIPAGEAAGLFRYNQVNDAIPQAALFWTSTASTPFSGSPRSYDFEFYDGQGTVRKDQSYNIFGYSVRCVRDYEVADPTDKPTVTTMDATNVGLYTATISGSINSPSGVIVVAKGFKWKEAASSEYNTEYLNSEELTFNLTDLSAGTEYSYFTFAIYDDGTAFGAEKTFTTWAKPTVSTGDITDIGVTTATLHGTLTNPNGVSISSKGFEWKTQNSDYQRIEIEGTENAFSYNFTGSHSTAYTVRTFVEFDGGSAIGGEISFVTKTPPTVTTTQSLSYVGANAATMSGSISALGNVSITERGIELKVKGASDETYVKIPDTGTESSFSVEKLGLAANTDYIYRAYAKYEGGTAYGTAYEFKTKTEPTVTTESATGIGMKNATLNGSYTNDGAVNITSKGFEWTTSTFDHATSASVSSNDLTYDLTGLSKGTEYKFRAFVMFDGRTVYGNEETFSTNDAPEVTTSGANNVTTNAVQLGGTVAAHDNTIIAQGFLWKASESSSPYDTITQVAVSGNTITYDLTGLTSNTNYTYCAFARTADTTVYGASQDFTTHGAPTVETQEATGVGVKTATLNGTYIQPVNVTITSKGFVWALSTVEGYTDTVKCDNLTYNLTGLAESMEYKFNAFVVFDGDTLYSTAKTFSTKAAPTVITGDATNKGVDTVMLNGVITANGNTITKKGFLWKVTGSINPYDTVTEVVVSGDNITYELSGLTYNTSYTYRAFAKTADTTIYGAEKTFSTPNPALSVDLDVPSEIAVCAGGSKAATYTASVKEGTQNDFTDEYEYQWDVPSDFEFTVNKNECTVIYTATGTYTVSCTANHASGASLNGNAEVAVGTTEGAMPTFTTCEDDNTLSVTIKSQENVTSFDWGGAGAIVGGSDIYIYSNAGVYTITASSADNCTATKTISIGNKTVKPCTIDASHPAQTDITGGGYNGAPDGLETVENGKITSITDFDGNVYPVVQIGSQCWLAENMRCTHSPSTSSYLVNPLGIAVGNSTTTKNVYSKVAHWYNNDSLTYAPKGFGLLYNWCAAVDTYNVADGYPEIATSNEHAAFPCTIPDGQRRGICPKGWHVPTNAEWTAMEAVVNEDEAAILEFAWRGSHAGMLSRGCDWKDNSSIEDGAPSDYNNIERNTFGFNALPAGAFCLDPDAPKTEQYNSNAYFWCCDQSNQALSSSPYFRRLEWSKASVLPGTHVPYVGMSVRCVRDAENVPMVITNNASDIGLNSATLNGYVEANGNDVIEYGFLWIEPNEELHTVTATVSGNSFSAELSNLLVANTTYRYRAYVKTNNSTYYYGYHTVEFSTKSEPSVITENAGVTGQTTATLNGSITNPDGISITAKGFEWKETEGGSYVTVMGEGTGSSFSANLSNLTESTSYTFKAFITYNSTTVYGEEKTFTIEPNFVCGTNTVKDYDNNTYNTVYIGNQCWMKENLRTTHYDNGDAIAKGNVGQSYSEAAYFDDVNSSFTELEKRGYFYNWAAVMNNEESSVTNPSGIQGICPTGWHVPSTSEWVELGTYLGSHDYTCNNNSNYIAKALASETGWVNYTTTTHTCSPSDNTTGGNNSSGFNAFPVGSYDKDFTDFYGATGAAFFWSSTAENANKAYYYNLRSIGASLQSSSEYIEFGFSVRCVRNVANSEGNIPPSVTTSAATNLSATSATLNGTVAANGNTIVSQGFQWKAIEEDTYTTINASGETMTYNLSGLTANTGYTYRAFATTSPTDTVYGAEETFTTTDGSIPCTPPSFTTCEFDHTVTVLLDDNNVSTCDWGDDSQSTTTDLYLMENGKYTLKHTYTNTGSYTLTVSYGGCSATSSVTIAKPTTLHPCTGTAHNSSVYQQNGYNGEFDDGFEVAINGGIISVEDYDGNVYSVTEINGQCWLAENLRCTHSPKTGNNIVITGDVASFTSKAAYWYNNMESMFSTKNFGLLYNWCAAMDTARPTNYIEVPTVTTDFFDAWVCSPSTPYHRGICPKGWHLPSKDEIDAMLTYILDDPSYKETGGGQLSYYQTAAKLAVGCDWKLSDECNGYFSSEQEVSCESTAVPGNLSYPDRNIYGFNAIPAGYYQGENDFSGYAEYSFFWSCTPDSDWLAWYFRISDYNNCETFINKDRAKEYGMSVRCVRDAE